MSDTANIEIRVTSLEDQCGLALAARQREEILQTNPDLPPFTSVIPIYIILLKNGEAIAGGGLRPIEEENASTAEIKRMYVIPEARGQARGVSDLLMRQLELHALERGWTTLWLQTGRNMLSASKFYERHGYRLIPNYGEYVGAEDTISYEKVLT